MIKSFRQKLSMVISIPDKCNFQAICVSHGFIFRLPSNRKRDLHRLWVHFFGKIQIRISESENGFCVFLGKSINGSWIHKIHTQGGFFGSNRNPDFWDSQSERFFGRGFEKSTFDKQFFQKKVVRNRCLTCMTLKMNLCWWRALLILSYILFHVCHLFKLLVDCF